MNRVCRTLALSVAAVLSAASLHAAYQEPLLTDLSSWASPYELGGPNGSSVIVQFAMIAPYDGNDAEYVLFRRNGWWEHPNLDHYDTRRAFYVNVIRDVITARGAQTPEVTAYVNQFLRDNQAPADLIDRVSNGLNALQNAAQAAETVSQLAEYQGTSNAVTKFIGRAQFSGTLGQWCNSVQAVQAAQQSISDIVVLAALYEGAANDLAFSRLAALEQASANIPDLAGDPAFTAAIADLRSSLEAVR